MVPLLVATGAAGLAWRTTKLRPDLVSAAEPLRQAWLLEVGRDALRDEMVAALAAAAEAKGIEVLIYKGWAAARSYPGPGLRPSGDIDVIVDPADVPGAQEIASTIPRLVLDIHATPPPGVGSVGALLARADRIPVDGATIAVPSAADHVLMTAWHMFKHGGWRPLWLCDVAAMLETAFDFATPVDEPFASYWSVAAGLSASMLGAHTEPRTAPEWVRRTVTEEWGSMRFRAIRPAACIAAHFAPASAGGVAWSRAEPPGRRGGARAADRFQAGPHRSPPIDRPSLRSMTAACVGHTQTRFGTPLPQHTSPTQQVPRGAPRHTF